jgi:hypothetical protein
MKDVIRTVLDFMRDHGINVDVINVRTTVKGQVKECTGTFSMVGNKEHAIKAYRKTIVSTDYRFNNTVLEFGHTHFIITRK